MQSLLKRVSRNNVIVHYLGANVYTCCDIQECRHQMRGFRRGFNGRKINTDIGLCQHRWPVYTFWYFELFIYPIYLTGVAVHIVGELDLLSRRMCSFGATVGRLIDVLILPPAEKSSLRSVGGEWAWRVGESYFWKKYSNRFGSVIVCPWVTLVVQSTFTRLYTGICPVTRLATCSGMFTCEVDTPGVWKRLSLWLFCFFKACFYTEQ